MMVEYLISNFVIFILQKERGKERRKEKERGGKIEGEEQTDRQKVNEIYRRKIKISVGEKG
jgi:hypothetical protein